MLTLLTVSGAAYESCRNTGTLQSDGSMSYNFEWGIEAEQGYYYPADGDWSLYISGQAENVQVRNGDGDIIEYEVRDTSGAYSELWMSNDERIGDSEEYIFNVTYTLPKAATVYEDTLTLNRNFFNFCSDGNTLSLQLPEGLQPENPTENYNPQQNKLVIQDFTRQTIDLKMKSNEVISPTVNYRNGIFNITSPRVYREHIINQTDEAENTFGSLNNYTGLPAPELLQLEYADPESDILIEGAAGQYSSGEITIPASRLSESRAQSFETLIHEMVHAYNDRENSSVSDWWWEEGTAEYITSTVMRRNGYTVANFYPSEHRVNTSFKKCSYRRSSLQEWNPVGSFQVFTGICPTDAEDVIRDGETLGYAYSRVIIEELAQKESGIVSKVQGRMYELNVTFTEDRVYRNNQINFFASQAADQDITDFLEAKGLETDSWEEEWTAVQTSNNSLQDYRSSTRFNIFKPQEEELQSIYSTFYSGRFDQAEQNAYVLQENLEEVNQSYSQVIPSYIKQKSRIERLETRTEPEFFESERTALNQSVSQMENQNFEQALQIINQVEKEVNTTYTKIQRYREINQTVSQKLDSANILESIFTGKVESQLQQSREAYRQSNLDKALQQIRSAEKSWQRIGNKVLILLALISLGLLSIIGLARRRRILS